MFTFNFDKAELLFNCFIFYIFYYSLVSVLAGFSLTFWITPILLYFCIRLLSLKPPEQTSVDCVLGLDPRFRLRNAESSDGFLDSTSEAYFCIAYRSAPFDSAKNNLNAIKRCAQNGCKIVHVEVKLTSDNVAVITRDTTVLFRKEEITMEKPLEQCNLDEIKQNFTRDCSGEVTQEMIPTLDEVIEVCRTTSMKLIVHLIHSSYYKSLDLMVLKILDLFEKNRYLHECCIISCTNPLLLYKIRKKNSNIVTAFCWSGFSEPSTTSVSWLKNNAYGNRLYGHMMRLLDEFFMWSVVEYWENRNVRCVAATVNLPVEKLYYKNALAISYMTETVVTNPC